MKFLPKEYNAIKQCIESSNHSYEDFFFVKRRGKLNIEFKEGIDKFIFYRHQSSNLIDGKLVDTFQYEVNVEGDKVILNNLDELVDKFKTWVNNL